MQERDIAASKLSVKSLLLIWKRFGKTTNCIVDLRNYCKLRCAAVYFSD